MKNTLFSVCLVAGTMLSMAGCGSGDSVVDAIEENVPEETISETPTIVLPTEVQTALAAPSSKLSQELTDTLAYMGNEERLAYDVYNALYEQYGTKQFTSVATNGEYQHIGAVQQLIQKYKLSDDINFTNVVNPLGYIYTPIKEMEAGLYDVPEIQKLYDDLMALATDEIEALKVGCIIEVVDVNDLTHDIALAESENATDIVTVFNFLRDGSYNHYWAFDKGLKNKDVAEGCCALGVVDGVDYCHPEYPQK
jgi:hypothetical protein